MERIYKTVRLSYEAKVWINDLIAKRNEELQKELKNNLAKKLEDELFKANPELLNGVSINLILKVTNGSVIEQAVRDTKHYDIKQWREIAVQMESAIKKIGNTHDVDDITPRLYLNVDILEELEQLQIKLKSEGYGMPRLSYIIKLVVYAFHSQNKI